MCIARFGLFKLTSMHSREQVQPIVGLGVMEATVHVRSCLWQLPFGDQAMAITRQRFKVG